MMKTHELKVGTVVWASTFVDRNGKHWWRVAVDSHTPQYGGPYDTHEETAASAERRVEEITGAARVTNGGAWDLVSGHYHRNATVDDQ
jgi:hypothetical protein